MSETVSNYKLNLMQLKLEVYEGIHKMRVFPSDKTAEVLEINLAKLHNMNPLIANELRDFYLSLV